MPSVNVLIPTCGRPAALAVTLASLAFQSLARFSVIIADQGDRPALDSGEVRAVARLLEFRGHTVEAHRNLPRRGMAQQRQFLLDRAGAPYVLFLDDDLLLEPSLMERMLRALRQEGCGFVGCGLIGLSYLRDVRSHEQAIEFWDGPVRPEDVRPDTPQWERYRLHNAANLYHVQARLGITPEKQRTYRVAWVGGCVLYDRAKLVEAGGFTFWKKLPEVHCGEDIQAQLQVMRRYGGCGLLPSGAYHQELATTLPDRTAVVPRIFYDNDH